MDTKYLIHPQKVPAVKELQHVELALFSVASSVWIGMRILSPEL